MRGRRGLVAVLITALIAATVLFVWQPWQQGGTDTGGAERGATAALTTETRLETVAVDAGAVFAEGRLAPQRQATLATETGGLVQEILVAEGDRVREGDILVRLDSREAQIGVQQARAMLAQAQANLAAAQARVKSAQEGARIAALGIEAAAAQLAVLTAAPQPEAVALAESALDAARAGVTQAAGERDVSLETDAAAIAAAEARLEAAKANLFAVRVANEPATQNPDLSEAERTQAQLRLNAAIVAVDAARAELEALQRGATESEARAANSAVTTAAQQQAASQAELNLLQVGARPEAVAIAAAEVTQARQAAAEAEAQVHVARAAARQVEAQVIVAQAELEAAQAAVDRRTVRAPFDGTVVEITIKVAQTIAAGTPLVTVADTNVWQVLSRDLTELDVVKIEEGQRVEVRMDAFPDEVMRAEIWRIAGAPTSSGSDVTYEITAVLQDAPQARLRWGMTAFLTIE